MGSEATAFPVSFRPRERGRPSGEISCTRGAVPRSLRSLRSVGMTSGGAGTAFGGRAAEGVGPYGGQEGDPTGGFAATSLYAREAGTPHPSRLRRATFPSRGKLLGAGRRGHRPLRGARGGSGKAFGERAAEGVGPYGGKRERAAEGGGPYSAQPISRCSDSS